MSTEGEINGRINFSGKDHGDLSRHRWISLFF
jgi:hypothetical protein